jgi:hypothetical protein
VKHDEVPTGAPATPEAADRRPSVLLAFPDAGQVQTACAVSMIATALHSPSLRGVINRSSPRVPSARNYLVQEFLDSGLDWLWFVDTDMQFPADALDRLLEVADPDARPVVGGLCFSLKGREMCSTLMQKNADGVTYSLAIGWPVNEVVEVDATGAGCLLIHRRVLERMGQAFPSPNRWFADEVHDGVDIGHDIVFCERVKSLGYPVYVHTGVGIGHLKIEQYDFGSYVRWVTRNRFLVTGTGRCGLGYMAALFTSLGLTTGYQEVYDPESVRTGEIRWRPARGDASWLAAPFLSHFVGDVIHVVRHPMAVIGSLAGSGFFARGPAGDACDTAAWAARMSGLEPDAYAALDGAARDIALAAAHVVRWSSMIERHARVRVRVEDIDVRTVLAILEMLGTTREPARIEAALNELPRDINGTSTRRVVDWSDLPVDLEPEVRRLAEAYGYRA